MKKITFILFIFIGSIHLHAKTLSIDKVANEIVEKIIQKNITKVGRLDLLKLKAEFNEIQWKVAYNGFFSGSGGTREFAVNLQQDKTVIVNYLSMQNSIQFKLNATAIFLHEALSAVGYEDEDYQISSLLYLLSMEENSLPLLDIMSRFPQFINLQQRSQNKTYAFSGGSTVVGSGGDLLSINVKYSLMKNLGRWLILHSVDADQYSRILESISVQMINPIHDLNKLNSSDLEFYDGVLWLPYSYNFEFADREEAISFEILDLLIKNGAI